MVLVHCGERTQALSCWQVLHDVHVYYRADQLWGVIDVLQADGDGEAQQWGTGGTAQIFHIPQATILLLPDLTGEERILVLHTDQQGQLRALLKIQRLQKREELSNSPEHRLKCSQCTGINSPFIH